MFLHNYEDRFFHDLLEIWKKKKNEKFQYLSCSWLYTESYANFVSYLLRNLIPLNLEIKLKFLNFEICWQ